MLEKIMRLNLLIVLIIAVVLTGCASNESMVQSCADASEEIHPVLGIPFLLVGCIGAAVGEQLVGLGEAMTVSPVIGIGTQIMAKVAGDDKPSNFVFHGEWCGPDHPKKGSSPEPRDELDSLCKRHDTCYETRGYYSCRCDVELARDIQNSRSIKSENSTKAGLIVQYFKDSYCEGCKQMKTSGGIKWSCHTPEKFNCKMGLVSEKSAYAWCPNVTSRSEGVSTNRFENNTRELKVPIDSEQIDQRSLRYMDSAGCLREPDGSMVSGFNPDECI